MLERVDVSEEVAVREYCAYTCGHSRFCIRTGGLKVTMEAGSQSIKRTWMGSPKVAYTEE